MRLGNKRYHFSFIFRTKFKIFIKTKVEKRQSKVALQKRRFPKTEEIFSKVLPGADETPDSTQEKIQKVVFSTM